MTHHTRQRLLDALRQMQEAARTDGDMHRLAETTALLDRFLAKIDVLEAAKRHAAVLQERAFGIEGTVLHNPNGRSKVHNDAVASALRDSAVADQAVTDALHQVSHLVDEIERYWGQQ